MKTSFQHLAGEVYRQYDEETVYYCNCCGKPKLYLNENTKCYTCFVCGYGGRVHTASGPISLHGSNREEPHFFASHYNSKQPSSELTRRGVTHPRILNRFFNRGVFLHSHGESIGFHSWEPYSSIRYMTHGARGVHVIAIEHTGPVFVFEGLFDWTSAFQSFAKTGMCGQFVFTAGNQITPRQADSIFAISSSLVHPVYICFDNDKPSAAAQAMTMLGSIREVHFRFPPKEWKDWDDAIQKGGVRFDF